MEKFAREMDTGVKYSISESAMQKLRSHNWPGNVRELENEILRSMATAKNGLITNIDPGRNKDSPVALPAVTPVDYTSQVFNFRRAPIKQALKKSSGNKTQAALLLGLKRTTLNSQIKELGIGNV